LQKVAKVTSGPMGEKSPDLVTLMYIVLIFAVLCSHTQDQCCDFVKKFAKKWRAKLAILGTNYKRLCHLCRKLITTLAF
jgi:hypothetical protein